MSNSIEKLLQEEIHSVSPNIPAGVFHFDFDRSTAESYLKEHLGVPFIIRKSSVDNFYALDTYSWEADGFGHLLIESFQGERGEFKLYRTSQDGIKPFSDLTDYTRILWERIQNRSVWHKLKENLSKLPEQNCAVLSIQSLDKKKVVLRTEQLDEFARNNPGLQRYGDGHTGFALAKALQAPFVVLRSQGKREEVNSILKERLSDNAMLVVTGHGSPDSEGIGGNYINLDALHGVEAEFNQQIERGPGELVSSIMEGGIKKGDHITLLLCICYAAVGSEGKDNSFAHRLAREFAAQGISTTIVASDKPVNRFGYDVIDDGVLTFDNKIGIAPADVCVFTTKVQEPCTNPEIATYKPNESISLSRTGLRFLNLRFPWLNLQSLKLDSPSIPVAPALVDEVIPVKVDEAVKKQASDQPDLLMKIQNMKNYGKSLLDLNVDKGHQAVELAEALEYKLVNFLLESNLTDESIAQFKSSFNILLHSQDLVMQEHREQWKPIVINILIALTGIGLLALLLKIVCHAVEVSNQNKAISFNQSFFFAKTKTQELEEAIEDSVNSVNFN